MIMDRIALILTVIGALNWGSIGIFNFDIVAWLCGGPMSVVSRIVYTVVALAGVWCISLIFRARDSFDAIEEKWKKDLEMMGVLNEMAEDLCYGCLAPYEDEKWLRKYVKGYAS